jgi:hypothetical protein
MRGLDAYVDALTTAEFAFWYQRSNQGRPVVATQGDLEACGQVLRSVSAKYTAIGLFQTDPVIGVPKVADLDPGEVAAGRLTGYTINGGVVREQDEFDYSLGTNGFVKHKPMLHDTANRRIIAAWAVAESRGRPSIVAVLSIDEVLAIKERSKGAKKPDSPWNDVRGPGFAAMVEKTAKRRLARSMPLSVMQTAAALEDHLDMGEPAHLDPLGDLQVVGEASAAPGPVSEEKIVTKQPDEILTPANQTVVDWPKFASLKEWLAWSREKFLPGANEKTAMAWQTQFLPQLEKLKGNEDAYDELMTHFNRAMGRLA